MAKLTFRSDDHKPEEGQWRTFRGWREVGFGVLKGEKARRFVHGVAVFHESQVDYLPAGVDDDFDPYDEAWALGMGGPMWWKD